MTAITVQVVNDGIEVNLKYGFMTTKLQFIANAFKLIGTCSLEKNQFVLELLNRFAFKQVFSGLKERSRNVLA